jgi:ribosomal protein S18 acetylase RimI-like enzyme
MEIRQALEADDAALVRLLKRSWSWSVGPAPPREGPFFASKSPADVLVAEVDGGVAGYVLLGHRTPLPTNAHVLEVRGLAVDPDFARRGIGRALLAAAIEAARRRGAAKLGLRVFAENEAACALYRSCGFEVVGVLRDEFRAEGRSIDDMIMELRLG